MTADIGVESDQQRVDQSGPGEPGAYPSWWQRGCNMITSLRPAVVKAGLAAAAAFVPALVTDGVNSAMAEGAKAAAGSLTEQFLSPEERPDTAAASKPTLCSRVLTQPRPKTGDEFDHLDFDAIMEAYESVDVDQKAQEAETSLTPHKITRREHSSGTRSRRQALVVGNNYTGCDNALDSCFNDAVAVSNALFSAGFDTIMLHDVSRGQIFGLVLRLLTRCSVDTEAVVYYFSGHGCSFQGYNFLFPLKMPSPAELKTTLDYDEAAIWDMRIMMMLAKSKAKFKIVITDACRCAPTHLPDLLGDRIVKGSNLDHHLRSWNKSSDCVNSVALRSSGILTESFASGPDGLSVYTKILVPLIGEEGLELSGLYKKLQTAVREADNGMVPEVLTRSEGDFFFTPVASNWVDGAP